jgi:thioredoxin-related protein
MKKIKLIFTFLFLATFVFAQNYPTIEIGTKFPSAGLSFAGADDKLYQFKNHFSKKGLLVIFTCNTCPFVVKWEDRYKMIEKWCMDNEIELFYVNSNANKRDKEDSFMAMKKHAKKMDYQFPYLIDKESRLANAFGAKTTPHIFLFNNEKVLVYKGAIDDNYESAKDVRNFYLKDAIFSLSNGSKIKTPSTKAVGCSIKRATK